MLHRHLNHSEWTLAAIDDVISRGRLDDWKELRDAAASRPEILDRILRVVEPYLSDPYAQRYHFWNIYAQRELHIEHAAECIELAESFRDLPDHS